MTAAEPQEPTQLELSPVVRAAKLIEAIPFPRSNGALIGEVFTLVTELAAELEKIGTTTLQTPPRLTL